MEKMKNMIVLKNIKSNLVEEAIVVFKENAKIKQKQILINGNENNKEFDSQYCIKEAEEIILDYIARLEKNRKYNLLQFKFKTLKILNVFLVLALLTSILFLF